LHSLSPAGRGPNFDSLFVFASGRWMFRILGQEANFQGSVR
jgi:hypothetical protein